MTGPSRRSTPTFARIAVMVCGTAIAGACTRPPFARYIQEGKWADADSTFTADTSLMNDDWALLQAAKLYSSPDRGAYDVERARRLLRRLLARNPLSKYRGDAEDRLALIESLLHERDSASARQRALEERVAQLTSDARRLRTSLDSVITKSDSLQRNASKMEADLRDREEQLRALRLELARLKEIDLNPRPTTRPPQR